MSTLETKGRKVSAARGRIARICTGLAASIVCGVAGPAHAGAPTVIRMDPSGPFTVGVTLNGKPLRFLFDTALPGDGRIDVEVAKELGLKSDGMLPTGVEADEGIPLVRGENFEFGGLKFDKVTLWSVPLNAQAQPEATRIHGAVGWELLKGRVYTVDFAARTITVDDAPLAASGPGVSELVEGEQSPSVPVSLGGVPARATLNSGNMMEMVVPPNLLSQLTLTKPAWEAGQIGGGLTIQRARLVKPMTFSGVESELTAVDVLSVWPTPNMGFFALQPFAVTFDLPNKRVRLAKSSVEPRASIFGVSFDQSQKEGDVRILRVIDGGLASRAGVREGDILRAVNAKKVKEMPHAGEGVLAALRTGEVTLELEREGQIVTVSLKKPA